MRRACELLSLHAANHNLPRRLRVAAHDSEEPSKALQQQAGARVRRQHLEEFRRVRRVRAVRRMRAAPASCYHPHSALFPPHSSLPASPSPFPSPSPRQPAGCALQRMTQKSLLKRFSNKLVLVFGDSISKNFAGSVACVLYAASPGTIQNFRIANGNTKAYGVRVPSTNTRFASVFSNWLNQASGLGGSMNRVDLDKIDPQITDLLPLADIVVFQATNWWFPAINKWYLGGKEQSLSKEAAYEIGLKTLRDYVVKSGFKGRVALVGVSPSHYKVPGLKEGSCETSKILTAQQVRN
ncbi:unnamed protein product [Closterium sp. Naga37s-1]|nr:unnamed protein product [Closterium sp. Naga37s-1]